MAADLISLVICTRNRMDALLKCLTAVRSMVVPFPWELIVVDNGSRDLTRQYIQQFAREVCFPVVYVYEAQPGLSRARNRGIAAASGDLIIFTDDDCYPEPDFLVQTARVFSDPQIAFYGGRVLLYDPNDYPITIKTSDTQELLTPESFIPAGFIHGANMGFRRDLFEAIGGFNECLGAGTPLACGEDTEFIARALSQGYCGGYFPEPMVHHHHGRKENDAKKLMQGYDIGRGAFYMAMLFRPQVRKKYLKRWWWSMSWTRRAAVLRELRGAVTFCLTILCHRNYIPIFGLNEDKLSQDYSKESMKKR